MLALNSVDFQYVPGRKTLDHVGFHVNRGELYALLGRNGAGKTTCMEIIEGLREPACGTISLLGKPVTCANRKGLRSHTGALLQETALPDDLTSIEALRLYGTCSGREDDSERLLHEVGLDSSINIRTKNLSGGERRRLDFAIAIYGQPDLVILDEPTSGMDVDSRDRLWELVMALRDRGAAILMTTHYLEEAQEHADRIGILTAGSIVQEGTYLDLVAGLTTTISFRTDTELPSHSGLSRLAGYGYEIETGNPQHTLHLLLEWAEKHRIKLDGLQVAALSLQELVMRESGIRSHSGDYDTKETSR